MRAAVVKDLVGSGRWQVFDVTILAQGLSVALCLFCLQELLDLLPSVFLTDSVAVIKDLVGSGRWQMFDVTILV